MEQVTVLNPRTSIARFVKESVSCPCLDANPGRSNSSAQSSHTRLLQLTYRPHHAEGSLMFRYSLEEAKCRYETGGENTGEKSSPPPVPSPASRRVPAPVGQAIGLFGALHSRQRMCRVCGVCLLVKLFDAAGSLSMQGRRARPVV